MDISKWLVILTAVAVFVLGIMIGGVVGYIKPKEVHIVTEKVVTVEIEKPIVTQQIVELVKEVEDYKFIDEDSPVHKWIDPDNQAVVYIYPDGYSGHVMPLYTLVPPAWFNQILNIILGMNGGLMPPEIVNSIPKEWLEAVAPKNNFSQLGH